MERYNALRSNHKLRATSQGKIIYLEVCDPSGLNYAAGITKLIRERQGNS